MSSHVCIVAKLAIESNQLLSQGRRDNKGNWIDFLHVLSLTSDMILVNTDCTKAEEEEIVKIERFIKPIIDTLHRHFVTPFLLSSCLWSTNQKSVYRDIEPLSDEMPNLKAKDNYWKWFLSGRTGENCTKNGGHTKAIQLWLLAPIRSISKLCCSILVSKCHFLFIIW